MIKFELKENELIINLSGRLDSTNADNAWNEISNIMENNKPYEKITLDIQDLEYISSAGLRVVLKIKKVFDNFEVINANSDVYEIFEMTSFTEIIDIKKQYKQFSVDNCPVIGRGAKGTVYRINDDTIIKVYKDFVKLEDINREISLAKKAFVLGIPTAISFSVVKVGDKFGSMYELLDAKSFTEMIKDNPDDAEKYIKICADLLRQLNSTDVSKEEFYDYKEMGFVWLDTAAKELDKETYDKIRNLLNNLEDRKTMLHCDYHTNNLMYQRGETLIIDMDTLSQGHPIFELANIYITYVGFCVVNSDVVEDFLGIPYETAKSVWDTFLPLYLNTNDKIYIEEVDKKVKLLANVRLLRHTIRRADKNGMTDEATKTIEYAKKTIGELIDQVTTLDF